MNPGDGSVNETVKTNEPISDSAVNDEEKGYRRPSGVIGGAISVIALAFALFHITP